MLCHCLMRRWLPLVHMYSNADNLSQRVSWANWLLVYFMMDHWLKGQHSATLSERRQLLVVLVQGRFVQCAYMRSQSTYIYRVQSSVWRLPNYWPPTPSPTCECVLPLHQRRGVTHLPGGEGGGGQRSISRKTPDIGLASYSIISLRMRCTT